MLEEKLSYAETERIYGIKSYSVIPAWGRIYLEEGPEEFRLERRGRSRKGRPWKALKPEAEEDLLAEAQRLRAENDYLKNIKYYCCVKLKDISRHAITGAKRQIVVT